MVAVEIDLTRRDFARGASLIGLLLATGSVPPSAEAQPADWNKVAFEGRALPEVLKALGGATVTESKDIELTGPDIAENGAVVPVVVVSKLAGTRAMHILVEKNPNWLAASFTIPAGTEPSISTRIKMQQSANVIALVQANEHWFIGRKEIKVTLGGCGG
jgi:sulfur-oxidizing protein SoxY